MQSADKNIEWYKSKFMEFEHSLNGEKLATIHKIRQDAISKFTTLGFPTTKQEEWRFTNTQPISKIEFYPVFRKEKVTTRRTDFINHLLNNAIQVVFINGFYSENLSNIGDLSDGIIIGSLAEISKKHPELIEPKIAKLVSGNENAFSALNTAFITDGIFVYVPNGGMIKEPIQIVYIATEIEKPYAIQPRNLIIAGDNCEFKLIEYYMSLSDKDYLTNSVTEIYIGKNSRIEHNKIQNENLQAFHIGTTYTLIDAGSFYQSNSISLSGALVRNNITVVMNGERIESALNGLSLGRGSQLIDNHTAIDHAKPNCNSFELYKSILAGNSKGVFNGKILVRKDAQKTDAKQTNKTLLLSDTATMNTKPQLEIFADDVKCTHGATIGQLDSEQLFYLRSRGIDETFARDILTSAFASDIINRISIVELRKKLENELQSHLIIMK